MAHCPFQLVGLECLRRKVDTHWLGAKSMSALGRRGQFNMSGQRTFLPIHVGAVHVGRRRVRTGPANGTHMALARTGARQVADHGPRGCGQECDRQQHRKHALPPHDIIITRFFANFRGRGCYPETRPPT
jgi:hypothetical protein